MLALAVTFLVAAYLLGPGLLARLLLGFVIPRKTVVQTRSEEITRSIVQAILPLAVALVWAYGSGGMRRYGHWVDIENVISGVYSTSFFDAHRAEFFASARAFAAMNLCVLWRLYLLVILTALFFDVAILKYRRIRAALPAGWPKTALATLVLPRVSEWHVLLSDMLLPETDLFLDADLLTKSGAIYQGRVQDKMLGADGSLQSITLANPRRFLREEYRKAIEDEGGAEQRKKVNREEYWRPIPGNLFVVLASDVVNLNLRYVRGNPIAYRPSANEVHVLRSLLKRLNEEPERTEEGGELE